jgi:hypothetical protein
MKLVVCLPTRGAISIETALCIQSHLSGCELLTTYRLPVVTARNLLAQWAAESDADAVLWLDDDIWFTKAHVDTALAILEENPGVDMVTGLYSNRCAFGVSNALEPNDYTKSIAPLALRPGEVKPVRHCGFGFVMMRRTLLDKVGPSPFDQLPIENIYETPLRDIPGRMAEDFSFCKRVWQHGAKLVTERSLVVGHVDVADGLMYFPYAVPKIANGADTPLELPRDYDLKKLRLEPRRRNYDMKRAKEARSVAPATPST